MSGKIDKVKEQIEYYLSDENLHSDEFFRKEISNGGDVISNKFASILIIKILGLCQLECFPKM